MNGARTTKGDKWNRLPNSSMYTRVTSFAFVVSHRVFIVNFPLSEKRSTPTKSYDDDDNNNNSKIIRAHSPTNPFIPRADTASREKRLEHIHFPRTRTCHLKSPTTDSMVHQVFSARSQFSVDAYFANAKRSGKEIVFVDCVIVLIVSCSWCCFYFTFDINLAFDISGNQM